MEQTRHLVEGWPALMSYEMASRYLSISEELLAQLARKYAVPVIEMDDQLSRWRKQDLDRLVKKLPLSEASLDSDRPMRLLRLEKEQIEALASALAHRLNGKEPATDRKLVSIKEAGTILGIGRSSIYRMIEDGRLETRRIGRRTLIKMDAIEVLLAGT